MQQNSTFFMVARKKILLLQLRRRSPTSQFALFLYFMWTFIEIKVS